MQVRRLVAALRPAPADGEAGQAAREAAVVGACGALAAAFAEAPERRGVFLAEDGAVAILELLDQRSPRARARALSRFVLRCSGHTAAVACGLPETTLPVQNGDECSFAGTWAHRAR